MPTNSFDIIVLGNELSGLIAATLCAGRGYRVALIPGQEAAPAEYQHGEFTLPVEPFALVGLESPAVARAVDELNFTHLLRRKLRPTKIPFQLVTPTARLDVGGDDVILLRELDRELGADSDGFDKTRRASEVGRGLDSLFDGDAPVPATSYRARRDQAKLLATLEIDAETLFDPATPELVRTLWSAPSAISCGLASDQVPAVTILRCFDLWRHGAPRIEGNAAGLRELLLEKFKAHGGELLDVRPMELTYSWGRVSGVTTKSGDELGASQIIAAMPIDELAVYVGKGLKKLEDSLDELTPAGYHYTLNLVVDEAGIPEGMAETVLCVVDPSKPMVGSNLLAIYVGEPDDRARVVVSISAICPVPASSSHLDADFANLRVEIREALETVMPFVNQHTLLIHSPHESLPAEGRAAANNGSVAKAIAPRPVWRHADESEGIAGLPYQIGLKHLVMASEQVLPSFGLEGLFIVALGAAKIATAGVGKRKPVKGEVLGTR